MITIIDNILKPLGYTDFGYRFPSVFTAVTEQKLGNTRSSLSLCAVHVYVNLTLNTELAELRIVLGMHCRQFNWSIDMPLLPHLRNELWVKKCRDPCTMELKVVSLKRMDF